MIDPRGIVLEYRARVLVSNGDATRNSDIIYQIAVTGNPCSGAIGVYTPIVRINGDQSLASILLNTGLLYPNTLTSPGEINPNRFFYILSKESMISLVLQGGANITSGVAGRDKIWPSMNYITVSKASIGGNNIRSYTRFSVNPDTGILTNLVLTSSTGNQTAMVDVTLEKIYYPAGGGNYIEGDRYSISLAIPSLITGAAIAMMVNIIYGGRTSQ